MAFQKKGFADGDINSKEAPIEMVPFARRFRWRSAPAI
jgi:hypothetical protein